jgi:DNA mismatch repair protein MutL
MSALSPKIHDSRPVIRQLDEGTINRIAAGEVVERPASAVKELVENALDAGARRIEVTIQDGGKTLIRVADDGCGMSADDLPLALSRHATSKLDGADLLAIRSFGFRGEALPSLGAVGRLAITSRAEGPGHLIRCDAGTLSPVAPAALRQGTVVELRDLFHATPARLKFLRTDRAETQAITDILRRLALAEPTVAFTLAEAGPQRELLRFDTAASLAERATQVLGRGFTDNALPVEVTRDGLTLSGLAALPTYSRGAAVEEFLFVNGRPVRDKLLFGALQAAYSDVLTRGRYPAAVLFLDCDPHLVDVNVHPAKAEVRFRDPAAARGLIVSGLRQTLAAAGPRASSTVADETLAAFRPEPRIYQMDRAARPALTAARLAQAPAFAETEQVFSARIEPAQGDPTLPLGAARAQVHGTYILAQTQAGLVIVDQHAAHERLVYERLKAQYAAHGIAAQALLIPEIVDLPRADAQRLTDLAPDLARLGLHLEPFGGTAVAVQATPALLGPVDSRRLVADILDELADLYTTTALATRLDAILSRIACHGSIRAGRQMRADEMNALLREIEATPFSGQCNHGRPTWVELKLTDIERLFGRT